jgi:hypothetical protein
MYERHHEELASTGRFLKRMLQHLGVALLLVTVSLGIGMVGYVWLEGLDWYDAFLHASVTLCGMGVVRVPEANEAKVFVGLYAMYSGMIFLAAAGIIVAPVLHRVMHLFHLKED